MEKDSISNEEEVLVWKSSINHEKEVLLWKEFPYKKDFFDGKAAHRNSAYKAASLAAPKQRLQGGYLRGGSIYIYI